jgi:hypothetical protein
MSQQFLRTLSCVVGSPSVQTSLGPTAAQALEFGSFRCVFQVKRGDYQNPNTADIRIYNLNDATANRIQNEFTQLTLSAGYQGTAPGQIFNGTIKQVRKGRYNQLDSYVDVTAAEGDEAYNYSSLALSLKAGAATPQNMVEHFLSSVGEFGVTKGYVPELPANALPRGRVLYGQTRDELRDFGKRFGFSFNLNDGRLSIIPLRSYIPSGVVPLISPQTGLIGIPEQMQNGLNVRVLLNPSIKVGQLIQLDSKAINQLRYGTDSNSQATNVGLAASATKINAQGFYYVMIANHSGDTRGNPWYTDLVCLDVDASIPQSIADQAGVSPEAASIRIN